MLQRARQDQILPNLGGPPFAISVGSIGKSREIFGQPRNQRVEVEMHEEGTRMSGCQLENRKEPSLAPQVINS